MSVDANDKRIPTVADVTTDVPNEWRPALMFGLLLFWRLVEAVELVANRDKVATDAESSGVDPEDDGPWFR